MDYYNDYLMHYGIKGMKWGVRRYRNSDGTLTDKGKKRAYGMSKHQLKKKLKTSGDDNLQKVIAEYSSAKRNNKQYQKLGQQSNEIAKKLMESQESDYRKNPDGGYMSETTKNLYERHSEIDEKMRDIEIDIGNKFVQKFNDARLKDINYSGSVEKGREMLESYGKNYTVRYDGTIRAGFGFGGNNFIYDDDGFIRPYNMD